MLTLFRYKNFRQTSNSFKKVDTSKGSVFRVTPPHGQTWDDIEKIFHHDFYNEVRVTDETSVSVQTPKVYSCEMLKFTVSDGKKDSVGHVIRCPDLDDDEHPFRHVTFRSPIKAVLSGAIVEKYCAGVSTFSLQEIDSTCKTNAQVTIESLGPVKVDFSSTYAYVIADK